MLPTVSYTESSVKELIKVIFFCYHILFTILLCKQYPGRLRGFFRHEYQKAIQRQCESFDFKTKIDSFVHYKH